MQEILKDPSLREKRIVVRQFPIGTGEYRTTFKELHKLAIRNVIVDVPRDHIYNVLKHAQQVDMLSDYHNYFFSSLDVHTVDLDEFQYGGTNISGFSLVDTMARDFNQIISKMQSESNNRWNSDMLDSIYRMVSSRKWCLKVDTYTLSVCFVAEFHCKLLLRILWELPFSNSLD